eukprot:gene10409-biopygen3297
MFVLFLNGKTYVTSRRAHVPGSAVSPAPAGRRSHGALGRGGKIGVASFQKWCCGHTQPAMNTYRPTAGETALPGIGDPRGCSGMLGDPPGIPSDPRGSPGILGDPRGSSGIRRRRPGSKRRRRRTAPPPRRAPRRCAPRAGSAAPRGRAATTHSHLWEVPFHV